MSAGSQHGSLPEALSFRAATLDDADELARTFVEGLDTYRSFAPPGWAPPPARAEAEHMRGMLAETHLWCRVAELDGRIVGQVSFLPATRAARPVDDARLAHLRNLFISPELWGSGLAKALDDDAIEAARERGFDEMRLFTPADHGRARRFYEREGWTAAGERFHESSLGFWLVEYRYALDDAGRAGRPSG